MLIIIKLLNIHIYKKQTESQVTGKAVRELVCSTLRYPELSSLLLSQSRRTHFTKICSKATFISKAHCLPTTYLNY